MLPRSALGPASGIILGVSAGLALWALALVFWLVTH